MNDENVVVAKLDADKHRDVSGDALCAPLAKVIVKQRLHSSSPFRPVLRRWPRSLTSLAFPPSSSSPSACSPARTAPLCPASGHDPPFAPLFFFFFFLHTSAPFPPPPRRRNNKAGEDYREGRTEEDLVKFLNAKTGAKRTPGGGLLPDAGLVEELNELAKAFADESKRDAVLAQAKALVDEKHADDKYAKYYVKVMEKIVDQGSDYAAGEIARLKRVVDGGNVKADRIDSFHIRKNILEQF